MLRVIVTFRMSSIMLTLFISMAMVYSTTASPVYGRGVYGRVLRSSEDSNPVYEEDIKDIPKWIKEEV